MDVVGRQTPGSPTGAAAITLPPRHRAPRQPARSPAARILRYASRELGRPRSRSVRARQGPPVRAARATVPLRQPPPHLCSPRREHHHVRRAPPSLRKLFLSLRGSSLRARPVFTLHVRFRCARSTNFHFYLNHKYSPYRRLMSCVRRACGPHVGARYESFAEGVGCP